MLPPASFVHEQEKVEERWPAAVRSSRSSELNEFFAEEAARRHRHHRPGRQLQHPAARARAARPGRRLRPLAGAALRDERRLPGDRRARCCASAAGKRARADGRGRPAQLHRAEPGDRPAPGRLRRPRCTARTCCRAPASTRSASAAEGLRAFLERYGRLAAEPIAPIAPRRGDRAARSRSPTTCTRGRRAFAPAAPSGRSSAR